MSCLFLIGNGFDLSCGLKTRYIDVYENYVITESESENIKAFKEDISDNIEDWGDFELSLAEYAKKLSSEEELIECVRDFTVFMRSHLLREQERFNKQIENDEIHKNVLNEMLNSIRTYYKGINNNVDRLMEFRNASRLDTLKVATFNYTNVIDTCVSLFKNFYNAVYQRVLHIHGHIEDPVLGIDNETQLDLAYDLSKKGRRRLIKPIFNSEYDMARVEELKEDIRNANIICIFGLSLGDSDLTWRNEIINWIKKDSDNHLFFYDYDVFSKKCDTPSDRLDEEDDAKGALFEKWKIERDEEVYNRIHMPCDKSIFAIGKSIEDAQTVNYDRIKKSLLEDADRIERNLIRHGTLEPEEEG